MAPMDADPLTPRAAPGTQARHPPYPSMHHAATPPRRRLTHPHGVSSAASNVERVPGAPGCRAAVVAMKQLGHRPTGRWHCGRVGQPIRGAAHLRDRRHGTAEPGEGRLSGRGDVARCIPCGMPRCTCPCPRTPAPMLGSGRTRVRRRRLRSGVRVAPAARRSASGRVRICACAPHAGIGWACVRARGCLWTSVQLSRGSHRCRLVRNGFHAAVAARACPCDTGV